MGAVLGIAAIGYTLLKDKPQASSVSVSVPAKTENELELIRLQTEILKQTSTTSPEQEALYAKQREYLDQITADITLSPEEEAEFEKEYGLSLAAVKEQFGIESEKAGATQMASLVSRGMLETTTGETEIADTQKKFAELLGQQEATMLESKETAKYDLEAAKRELGQAGYQLTTGMQQSQMQTALQAAMGLETYALNRGGAQANAALENALVQQSIEKAKYQQRMNMWNVGTQLGTGVLKAGAGGLF